MSLYDIIGLFGVATILAAYAATVLGALHAKSAAALALNVLGPTLILASLSQRFNLSAAIVEAAWALIALGGLIRLALSRGRSTTEQRDDHR